MVTLEDQIAALAATNGELVSATSELTGEVIGKMAQIDLRVNEAIANLGANTISLFVKPSTGDDNNAGSHTSTALKSLEQAMTLACSPEYSGAYIYIYIEGGYDYHIDQSFELYNRQIHFVSFNSASKANIYFDAYVESGTNFTYFAMYGLVLYNANVMFEGIRLFTPMFSDISGHDSVFTQPSCGFVRLQKNSIKGLGFRNCEIQIGDQYILVTMTGGISYTYFDNCSVHLRSGRTSTKAPIELSQNATLTLNLESTTFNDGLSYQEGSLVSGVLFSSGVPINFVSNVALLEAA